MIDRMFAMAGKEIGGAERSVQRMKKRLKDLVLILTPVFQCYLIALFAFLFGVLPIAFVFLNMKKIGIFWLPIVFAYFLLLSVVARQLARQKELIEERALYGDELFFQVYPRLKKVEERKLRRKAWLESHLTHGRKKGRLTA